jgi:tryptophanyl-tRNA synthetase
MTVIFSGIQPTGTKHLGNYIGAITRYVAGQEYGDPAIYCVVDLHALTVEYDPKALRERVYDTTAILMASGLDPDRCILFRQGDVHEHAELTWMLSSVVPVGRLDRMHQFRDKAPSAREMARSGLLFYPVLMAADVLAYKAHEVPVGEDQREHVELMRDAARSFNARYGDILVVPDARIPEVGARIMDLQDPSRKMSTTSGSEKGTVYVLDEPNRIRKKFRSAVTDSETEIRRDPSKPGISGLIEVLAAVRGVSMEDVEREFAGATGYGPFKDAVADAVTEYLAPVRERYEQLRPDEAALEAALEQGAEKARAIASATLAEVRDAMGVGRPVRSRA